MNDDFEVIGKITNINTIAAGSEIREIKRLRKSYGTGRWRKPKGLATVHPASCRMRNAEVHWYEAHGIGKKEMKSKRYLD